MCVCVCVCVRARACVCVENVKTNEVLASMDMTGQGPMMELVTVTKSASLDIMTQVTVATLWV